MLTDQVQYLAIYEIQGFDSKGVALVPSPSIKNVAAVEPVRVLLVGPGIDSSVLDSETYRIDPISIKGSEAEILAVRNQKVEVALIAAPDGLNAKLVASLNLIVSGNFRRLPFIILIGPPPEAVLRSVVHSLGANEWFRIEEIKRHFPRILASVVKSRDDDALHDLLVERFDLALKNRKWNDARQALDGLLMLDERNAFLVSILSYAIEKRVDPASARDFLERIIINIPSNATIRAAVASIYLNLGLSEYGHQLLMELACRNPLFLPNLLSRHLFATSETGLSTLRRLYSNVFGVESLEGLLSKWHAASKDIDRTSDVESVLAEMITKLESVEIRQIAGRILGDAPVMAEAPLEAQTTDADLEKSDSPLSETMLEAEDAVTSEDSETHNSTDEGFSIEPSEATEIMDETSNIDLTDEAADEVAPSGMYEEQELSLEIDASSLADGESELTPDVAPIVVEIPLEQPAAALSVAEPAVPQVTESKFKPEELVRASGPSQDQVRKLNDFTVPENITVQLPKPKPIDFTRYISATKTNIENQRRTEVLVKTAPDRALEGSFVVYHFDMGGAAKLAKHLEDLGCKDVEVVSEKNELVARHRSKRISGLVAWIEPNRSDSIENLMDLLAQPAICPEVITAVFGSTEALKKTIHAYPSLGSVPVCWSASSC